MVSKHAVSTRQQSETSAMITFQDYFDTTRATHTEKSNIAYYKVLDAVADNRETVLNLLNDLYDKFIRHQARDYLVLAGDQKLYQVFQSLKQEYEGGLEWVIPMPGDWHLLKTYQSAIMKPYFDAGLKDLAKAAGYPVA